MRQSWSRPYSAVAFHHIVGEPVTGKRRLRGEGRGFLHAHITDRDRPRLRRGGYLTCDAVAAAHDKFSVPQPGTPDVLTVADWLETWVEIRVRLRDSTRRIYRSYIRLHFVGCSMGCCSRSCTSAT